ncbi:RNA polymerase sigma factor [Acutalibacter muris]|uniref:RNA polymerase sigma factor n=1 Tax=Acutalibacter muris TaxID=1796620 RepID=UPI001C3EC61B|nr:sigma-70 family RNA polymerase sigma factor [Acutalibacter muris]
MKEINLRKYYPNYTHDVMVQVSDEVADLLQELARAEDALRIRTYRHKAMYSLELMNEVREFPAEGPLPEEILEQSNMRELLYKGLQSLPEKQRSRLIAYYFLGMSKAEIARNEGSSVNSVKEGMQRALRNLEKFFEVFLR